MLYPCIFLEIDSAFGPLEVDLFASRVTYQTCHFSAGDQTHCGDSIQGISNLPWCLIGRVLKQVCLQKGQLVLVASVRKGQTWYPVLLEMQWKLSQLTAPAQDLTQRPSGSLMEMVPQLAVWSVLGMFLCLSDLLLQSWRSTSASLMTLTLKVGLLVL